METQEMFKEVLNKTLQMSMPGIFVYLASSTIVIFFVYLILIENKKTKIMSSNNSANDNSKALWI